MSTESEVENEDEIMLPPFNDIEWYTYDEARIWMGLTEEDRTDRIKDLMDESSLEELFAVTSHWACSGGTHAEFLHFILTKEHCMDEYDNRSSLQTTVRFRIEDLTKPLDSPTWSITCSTHLYYEQPGTRKMVYRMMIAPTTNYESFDDWCTDCLVSGLFAKIPAHKFELFMFKTASVRLGTFANECLEGFLEESVEVKQAMTPEQSEKYENDRGYSYEVRKCFMELYREKMDSYCIFLTQACTQIKGDC